MKTILVPTDFTPASKFAGDYAAALAKASNAKIHLLHVENEALPLLINPVTVEVMPSILLVDNQTRINKEVERLKALYSIDVSGSVVNGFKGEAIDKAATDLEADLIVMGIKNVQHTLVGSTAVRMIRKSDKPLLLIPDGVTFIPLKNIVLAVDFTEMVSRASLAPLYSLVKLFNSSVRVVHVEKKGAAASIDEVNEKMQMGKALSCISYYYDRIEYDDTEFGMLDFIHNHPTDLLVMISHQHTFLQRLFGLTHTRPISREANLPVLILKTN
jgi:nucleotide-binding universal stress UspA family protein